LGCHLSEHDSRYDAGDEYIEICNRLWDGFPRDAVVMDKVRGVFVDAEKVRRVDFEGRYYRCQGYPVVMCSPQGRPLIFQAGQSSRGIRFGVTHGDALYAIQSRPETMLAHMTAIRASAAAIGLPKPPPVFFGIQPHIAPTEKEARRIYEELRAGVPVDIAIANLSALVGADLSQIDPDASLESLTTNAGRGLLAALQNSRDGGVPTVREAALQYAMSAGMPQFVGDPEQVANWIESLWTRVGCHGFAISSTISPASTIIFADEVVPILQRRGLVRRAYAGTTFRENLLQQDG
jgi:alkanesulfonate monooxygenase SsuD/methylene tetrahydromethanopterin reductase-like flavin-dependent oxidoreductase (luciferase family)